MKRGTTELVPSRRDWPSWRARIAEFIVERPIGRRAANCRRSYGRGMRQFLSSLVELRTVTSAFRWLFEWIFALYRGARVPITGFAIEYLIASLSLALLSVRTDTPGMETRYVARGEPVLFRLLSPGNPELRIKFGSDAAGGDAPHRATLSSFATLMTAYRVVAGPVGSVRFGSARLSPATGDRRNLDAAGPSAPWRDRRGKRGRSALSFSRIGVGEPSFRM